MDNDAYINSVPAAAKAVNVNGNVLISMHCSYWCCYLCIIIFAFWFTILKQAMRKGLRLAIIFQVLTPSEADPMLPTGL